MYRAVKTFFLQNLQILKLIYLIHYAYINLLQIYIIIIIKDFQMQVKGYFFEITLNWFTNP